MLQNWLKPLSASWLKKTEHTHPESFAREVLLYRSEFPDLKKVKVALIGISEKESAPAREYLYRMAYNFPKGAVADLGNLRKAEAAVLMPVIYELLSGKIIPVVLSASEDMARAQFLAYQESKALVNLAVVEGSFQADTWLPVVKPRHAMLLHYALIGYQVHQTPASSIELLHKLHFDTHRLGKTRAVIEETEPVIRDADLVVFQMNALKQSEVPGVAGASPSGFFAEEACQICRYAGMSDKLTSFGIYGMQTVPQTAHVAAQMAWYFMDGVFNRKSDYPVSTTGMTEYVVQFRKLNYQLVFWKSNKSGRWWMQAPVASKRRYERHRLIPCSYQDYQAACREELPDRLMQALQRF